MGKSKINTLPDGDSSVKLSKCQIILIHLKQLYSSFSTMTNVGIGRIVVLIEIFVASMN